MPEEVKEYQAEMREVYSGDDMVLMVDLGVEGLHKRQRVRLHGVDTPNGIHADDHTEAGQLRSFVRDITQGMPLTLRVVSRVGSSWVGIVTIGTGKGSINLNDTLVAKGYQFRRDHKDKA